MLFFSDRKYRPCKRYYRWSLPRLLPDTTSAYESSVLLPSGSGTGSNPGSTGKPEVPAFLAVLPLASSEGTSGTSAAYKNVLLFFSGSCTGCDTGTTAKPEVPALPAELPASRIFSLTVGRPFLGGPEVPPPGPVLPVLRGFVSIESRWGCLYMGR